MINGLFYKVGKDKLLQKFALEDERELLLCKAHEGIFGGHFIG